MAQNRRQKLVVIGNGMAGARVVEEILARAPDRFDITMFGSEPYGNYNRILLSNVLNGSQNMEEIFINPLTWYEENGIRLHVGTKVIRIDRERRVVVAKPMRGDGVAYGLDGLEPAAAPIEHAYDTVIIATGSRPFVPPMDGMGKPGSFLFRTLDDCEKIAAYARSCRTASGHRRGLAGPGSGAGAAEPWG